MKNSGRLIDGAVVRYNGIVPADPGRPGIETSKVKATRRQYLESVARLTTRFASLFILLAETFVQLTGTATGDRPLIPVDTKVLDDIILIGIEVGNHDHLTETLQHQREYQKDDRYSPNMHIPSLPILIIVNRCKQEKIVI